MKNKSILLFTLLTLIISGCSTSPITPDPGKVDPSDPTDPSGGDVTPTPKEPTTNKTFLEFFDYESKIEIELDFTNQAITKLAEYAEGEGNDNFDKNEMYHPCTATITVNGKSTVLEETGARMKGNTSRDTHFVDSTGHFDTSHLCHFKLNFAQLFDDDSFYYVHDWTNDKNGKKERDDRKYGDMKKLDLKWNRNYDQSFTKEAYVLDAFRNEGVLAQHCNLVQLTVKSDVDSYTATYLALESIDKRLLKAADKNDSKGDLYKCTYTDKGKADLTGFNTGDIGVEEQYYRPKYNLKTNETDNDFSVMKNFINEVKKTYKSNGLDGQAYYDNISKYLDVDNFLIFGALSWVFGLPDDYRYNYNNYYIYFNKYNKAVFMPFDNDRCLGIRCGWDKDLKNSPWNDTKAIGSGGEFNRNPLVLRLLTGGSNNSHPVHEASSNTYHQLCIEFANKYLDETKFNEFTDKFYYSPNKDISSGGPDNDSFAVYASAKKGTLN